MMRRVLLALIVFCLASSAPRLFAEEVNAQEAKEAEEEAAAERLKALQLDRPVFTMVIGMLQMKPADQRGDGKGVVGTVTAKDKTYQLKLESPDLAAEFDKAQGKRVKIRGNPRNKGKYLLAQGVTLANPDEK